MSDLEELCNIWKREPAVIAPGIQVNQGITMADINIITGTNLDDTIVGTDGVDGVEGLDGNDNISGGAGDDALYGGVGDDVIRGDVGNDQLFAGPIGIHAFEGNDTLIGGAGDDRLFGDSASGEFFGGSGADELLSIQGDYSFTGGSGSDHFVIDGGAVSIEDFSLGEGDHLTFNLIEDDSLSISRDESAIYIRGHGISDPESVVTIHADPADMDEIIGSIDFNTDDVLNA
jgi:Ca2+-binding RTX toxin-like protein